MDDTIGILVGKYWWRFETRRDMCIRPVITIRGLSLQCNPKIGEKFIRGRIWYTYIGEYIDPMCIINITFGIIAASIMRSARGTAVYGKKYYFIYHGKAVYHRRVYTYG